ncbi:hypothetical protein [Sphingomonas sp.]|uniref:hypothetical protein n=1 Tax=Sphingomonas sp. TaxID=28214 RepID=UPI0035BC1993
MIVPLLIVIAFILLFGAAAVKGWVTNIFGFGVGGVILLVPALKLGSYLGEYGLFWVIAIVAGVVTLGFAIGINFEDRARAKALGKVALTHEQKWRAAKKRNQRL